MSLTVDELAKEIDRVDGGQCLGDRELAELLLPFIERHIAAGQQGAGDAQLIEAARYGWQHASWDWSAVQIGVTDGRFSTPQQPKPAGAVPLPEPSQELAKRYGEGKDAQATEADRLAFEAWMRGHCWALCATWRGNQYQSDAEEAGRLCPDAMRTRMLWAAWRDRGAVAADQLRAYGDAREAAGRAVAVPFDFARARTLIGYVIGYARATELRSLSSDACVALQDLHAMFETAPTPQQPAADGACICDGATYAPDQRYPFIVNRACPRHGGATSAAEGAGREAVEAFERLTAMKFASDHDGYCQRLQDIAAIRRHLAQPTPAAITYSDQQRIIDLTLSEAYCAGHDGKTFDMLAATKKINAAFAHHTPAADAGGVTLEYADRVLSEYVRIQINEHTDRATEEHRVDAMRRALTAALAPEVRRA